MTITHLKLVNYLKNLVKQNNDIGDSDFFRMNIAEIQGAIRTGICYPCFSMESHEGNFDGSQTNNSLDSKMFAFTILGKPEYGDFDNQNEVLDNCEIIGKKFISRMRYDSTKPDSLLHKLFEVKNVSYHKVGPLYTDHCYGYRFEIPLKPSKVDLQLLPSDWKDIDVIC